MTLDKSDQATTRRREFIKRSATALVATSLPASYETLALQRESADQPAAAADDVFPLRTITAGVNIATERYAEVFTEADKFLRHAQRIMEAEGFPVQTTRITTQPGALYMQGVAIEAYEHMLEDMRNRTEGHRLAVGPGIVDDQ